MNDCLPKSKKYLLFSMVGRKTGVDNVFRMLNLIFQEAHLLDRTLVIGKFTMSSKHNLGKFKTNFCFEDYLDLSAGAVFVCGGRKQLPLCLDWIKEEELDLANYSAETVRTLCDDEIVTEKMNQRYDVLIRRDPTFKYVTTSTKYKSGLQIKFPYSKKVNQLTDEVLGVLGVSREHAIAAQRYFLSKINDLQFGDDQGMKIRADSIPLDDGYYACLHVRASIKDRDYKQRIFPFSSSKEQIQSVLANTLGKGAKLYIMSDVHRPKFFDFLKADYQIYRYHDIPALKQLVSGEEGNGIDNVMLYLVEKNIMRHATVKILPPHKGPMIYHLNTMYDVYALKNPPVLRRFLVIKRNIIKTVMGILARLKTY